MKFKEGTAVEVAGDPEDKGFAGSWWTGVVVKDKKPRKGMVKVQYDEMLEEDGETRLVEWVEAQRVRPLCADDSMTVPISRRQPGDPVDCWHDDGWWEGYVHRVYDDRITVFFPLTSEEYDDIFPAAQPKPDPEAHRVRTGKDWDAGRSAWVPRLRKSFAGAGNFRSAPPAAGGAAPAHGRRDVDSSSSGDEEEDAPLNARRAAMQKAPRPPKQQEQQLQKQEPKQQKQKQQQQQRKHQTRKPAETKQQAQPAKEAASKPVAAESAAAKAADQRGSSEPPEGGVQAAQAKVADLLTSLDFGDESEEDGGPAGAPPVAMLDAAADEVPSEPPAAQAAEEQPAAGKPSAERQEQQGLPPTTAQQQRLMQQQEQDVQQPSLRQEGQEDEEQRRKNRNTWQLRMERQLQQHQRHQKQQDVQQPPRAQHHHHQQQQQPVPASHGVMQRAAGGAAAAEPKPAKPKGKATREADKQLKRQRSGQPERAGNGVSAKGGGDGTPFIIPKRVDSTKPAASVPVESPRAPAASPRAAAGAAARQAENAAQSPRLKRQRLERQPAGAAAAAAAPAAAQVKSVPVDAHAAAAPAAQQPSGLLKQPQQQQQNDPRAAAVQVPQPQPAAATAAAPAPLIPKVAQQQEGGESYDPAFPTAFCLDNLPASITGEVLQEALEGLGFAGIKSVRVATVPLDAGDRHGGYAVLRFASHAAAQQQLPRLRNLCLLTPTCAVPRPLIVHEPHVKEGYSWGPDPRLPGHLPLDFTANQHFAQPSSIEFDLALEWRQLSGVLRATKAALVLEQAAELAQLLASFLKENGKPAPALDLPLLALPGEQSPGSAGAAGAPPSLWRRTVAAPRGSSPPSSCVWLSGVPCWAQEEALIEAFSQFGYPQKAHLVLDPITQRPTGHAVLWMESEQRAQDLVQNLTDMVYMLNSTPRAVQAALALPGPPRGSQSAYDRALRCVFGADDSQLDGDVRFLEVPDEVVLQYGSGGASLASPECAAVALRRLMTSHLKEQAELKRERRRREAELDARHQRQLNDERFKLGRLAQMQLAPGPAGQPLLQYLLERHGLRGVKVMKNKEAVRLAGLAAAEQRRRDAEAAAPPGRHARPPQGQQPQSPRGQLDGQQAPAPRLRGKRAPPLRRQS